VPGTGLVRLGVVPAAALLLLARMLRARLGAAMIAMP
jgi:hypothetical protein